MVQPQGLNEHWSWQYIRDFGLGWSYLIRTSDRWSCGVWTRPSGKLGLLFMVGNWPARGLYTLLTDSDLEGCNFLGNLCKGLVASLCSHTSVVWYDAWPTSHAWVQSSSELLRDLWWKYTTSAECKTNQLAVLTVKSALNPLMIIELKDELKLWYILWLWLPYSYGVYSLYANMGWYIFIF
jgi:hypothetical protein